jgi:hypothetical protein
MSNFPQNPQLNQIISYDAFIYRWDGKKWLVSIPPDPLTVPVFVSEVSPTPPITIGTLWFKVSKNIVNVWAPLPAGSQWLEVENSTESLGAITVSKSAPANPASGALWYDPVSKNVKSWANYIDPPSWITLIQASDSAFSASSVVVSEEQPSNPVAGLLWYKKSGNSLNIWTEEGGKGSWQEISSSELYGQPTVAISLSPPLNPREGDLWWDSPNQQLKVWNSLGPIPYWQSVTSSTPESQGIQGISGGLLSNALTFDNSGSGAGSGTTFNGSLARTISYDTIGAAASDQTMFIGTTSVAINRTTGSLSLTGVSIDGNAGTVTGGVYLTGNQTITGSKTFTALLTCSRAGVLADFDRTGSDGDLVRFQRDSATQGIISVASGTVTYGAFLGSHWAKLSDETDPNIPVGTVLEAISEEVIWKVASFVYTDSANEEFIKRVAYNGLAEVGDTLDFEYEGVVHEATIEDEEEDNPDRINKHVKVKVSDTFGSPSVYGVFISYDKSAGNGNIEGYWNDIVLGSVGNFVVRIAAAETVNIGDLLISDGTGCAVAQEDDIIRSKTIGKVTSTKVQKIYEDGSYLVPCVLYCG